MSGRGCLSRVKTKRSGRNTKRLANDKQSLSGFDESELAARDRLDRARILSQLPNLLPQLIVLGS